MNRGIIHLCLSLTVWLLQELSRSLKQVESSKDETSDEFERLQGKKDEMEIQLVTLQQSINSVSIVWIWVV